MKNQTSTMNASTGTCGGKLAGCGDDENGNDESCTYVDLTERLLNHPELLFELGAGGDKNCKLPMRKSLFAHVPPYIIFQHYNWNRITLPPEITKHLVWKHATRFSPQMIRLTVTKSGFTYTRKNNASDWSGAWGAPLSSDHWRTLKTYQKINHFPGSLQLSHKDHLWKNVNRMTMRFGRKEFGFLPTTYVFPKDLQRFRKLLEKYGGTWIVKPPAGCAGSGIRVISRWCEIPKNCPLVVQRYLTRPKLIGGVKFDMRLYVLVTSVNPLLIYFYSEGLVRFATAKYVRDASFYFDRYMHLTNTSINKTSPRFRSNDSLDKCKGNMWSLNSLWTYLGMKERVSIPKLWDTIKDIAIKTIISAESPIVNAVRSNLPSSYNSYQLLGFDIILDDRFRPWLLEVNNFPSMDPDTPLCSIVKGQLARDYLNIVGYQIPNILSSAESKTLTEKYELSPLCHDHRLYNQNLTSVEKEKQIRFSSMKRREDYLKPILENLTPDDVRRLIRYEDENTQVGRFDRIFPTRHSYKYLRFFDQARYYNLLLDAWEDAYGNNRSKGILRLQKLCKKKYHLGSSVPSELVK